MKSQLRFLLSVFIFCSIVSTVIGQTQQELNQLQNMSAAELSTFNVDDLSDAQIQLFLNRLSESGYSEAEIELALKTRGLPQAHIDKLKLRMAKLQSGETKSGSSFDRARTRETPQLEQDDLVKYLTDDYEEIIDRDELEKNKRVFGYKLFNSENLTFEPNLNIATPRDYQLGPGDEVIMPGYFWVSTAGAVIRLGAIPVLVDVDPDTWCLDISQIINKITAKTKSGNKTS